MEYFKMNDVDFIEYNSSFIDYARENRRKQTKQEKIFWNILLKNKKFMWYKFTRQKPIWPFILDFYCSELLLWIEIDGWYHKDRAEYDKMRDSTISHTGILIIRFTNEEVDKHLFEVQQELKDLICKRESDLHLK